MKQKTIKQWTKSYIKRLDKIVEERDKALEKMKKYDDGTAIGSLQIRVCYNNIMESFFIILRDKDINKRKYICKIFNDAIGEVGS